MLKMTAGWCQHRITTPARAPTFNYYSGPLPQESPCHLSAPIRAVPREWHVSLSSPLKHASSSEKASLT